MYTHGYILDMVTAVWDDGAESVAWVTYNTLFNHRMIPSEQAGIKIAIRLGILAAEARSGYPEDFVARFEEEILNAP